MSSHAEFESALTDVYVASPCQLLPNALWKTRRHIARCETTVWSQDGRVTGLLMHAPAALHVYWRRDRARELPAPIDWARLDLDLVHQDFISLVPRDVFAQRTAYFRLIHRGSPSAPACPPGFRIEVVNLATDVAAVAALIDACYPSISPSIADVRGWAAHPVFDPSLWIWIVDIETDQPVALGVAEFDPKVKEGSLEWIQVLPGYRGRGLGTTLVRELLNRLEGCADFTTVAGLVDNETHPERLYRRCGFTGEDVWWVFADSRTP